MHQSIDGIVSCVIDNAGFCVCSAVSLPNYQPAVTLWIPSDVVIGLSKAFTMFVENAVTAQQTFPSRDYTIQFTLICTVEKVITGILRV